MSRRELIIYGLAFVVSAALHIGLFEGLGSAARSAPSRAKVLEFAVIEPPPPPPPEPEPKPKPKPPPPKEVDLTEVKQLPEVPPPPNTEAVEEPVEEARPVFGITMSSTVGPGTGSGFSVRIGNTLMKDPDEAFTPPEEVKVFKPVPLHKVTRMPKRIDECMADYPPAAKQLGIEGRVKLEVEIQTDGTVGGVRVVSGLGHGLDDAAVLALRKCRFQPAESGGRAVPTRIIYTYTFFLED